MTILVYSVASNDRQLKIVLILEYCVTDHLRLIEEK